MNVQSSDDLPPSLSVFASLGILPVGVLGRVYKEGKRSAVKRGFVTGSTALLSASTDISKRYKGGERLACLGVCLRLHRSCCTSLIDSFFFFFFFLLMGPMDVGLLNWHLSSVCQWAGMLVRMLFPYPHNDQGGKSVSLALKTVMFTEKPWHPVEPVMSGQSSFLFPF